MRRLRRLLRAFAAIAAVLFGLEQLGGNPLSPEPDLGFAWESGTFQGQRVLVLSTDYGNLDCWVRLELRCKVAEGLTAKLSDGTPLAISSVPSGPGTWIVEIAKRDGPRYAKFEWASGTKLLVAHDRASMEGAVVEDWRVHSAGGKDDSKLKEIWRRVWLVLSLVLLAGLLAGVFIKEEVPERPAPTPELYIAIAIEGVEGSSTEDTEKLQSILKDVVLEGTRVEDALRTVAGGVALWFRARGQFLNRLDHVIETLRFYRGRLE